MDSGNETEALDLLSQTNLIENNFVKLKVFLEDLDITTLEDTPKMTGIAFLSELGGAMNLYIGINLILVVEFLELSCHLAGRLCSWGKC